MMTDLVQINVYYFPELGSEPLDEVRDVRSTLGGFTWRREGQEVPKALRAVLLHVTCENPCDIYDLAESIRNHFAHDVNREESFRVASLLYHKITLAKTRMGNRVQYEHSDSYIPSSREKVILGAD